MLSIVSGSLSASCGEEFADSGPGSKSKSSLSCSLGLSVSDAYALAASASNTSISALFSSAMVRQRLTRATGA